MYKLHNGQDVSGASSGRLFCGLPFIPIEYSLEMHDGMIASHIDTFEFSSYRHISEEIKSDDLSPMSKFPIAGGDDLYNNKYEVYAACSATLKPSKDVDLANWNFNNHIE